jgi:hypothetical protein
MPHISQVDRQKYVTLLSEILRTEIETKGDLEYLVYNLMKQFMATREKRYATFHEAVYATVHCAHEFERLYLDKREDKAISDNGEA